MPLVIQTEHLSPDAASWLGQRVRLVRCVQDSTEFPALLAQAEGLVIRTYTKIDATLLAAAPKLRVVGRAGVGLDNVDLPACAARKIVVCNTPDANTRAVVEYVLALMLDATRPRLFLDRAVTPNRWKALREELKATRQLCQMTLGIWGLGKIGRQIARVGTSLNMRVIYHDLLPIDPTQRFGAEPVSRADLCAQADILTIHVDGRRANRDLIGPDDFGRMKSDVVFINSSRGFVVRNDALAAFMRSHASAQALLDVHEPEPFGESYALLGIPNIHLAPHIASSTVLANDNMSRVVEDVWRVLQGQVPQFPAAPEPE
jgi:phosphoglycerate dehydrogenase-like enzyme